MAACLLFASVAVQAQSNPAPYNRDWQPPGFTLQRADGSEFHYPEDLAGPTITLLTTADAVAEAWGVKGTPGLFLADGDGRVVFDRMRLPPAAERAVEQPGTAMKHYQKAARNAPYWAARLRVVLDQLQD